MDISIVSGTYNRIDYLQKMINSGRQSFKNVLGLDHEFVLVDGGSTDGTLDWIEAQPDCRLIQHGELLGAVKAFNDGAFAAMGQYVVLANDDIEFLDKTLLTAYVFMQTNLDCGVGCFFQDRNRHEWHVEVMPVIKDGVQSTAYYGQVCIVPKWLGDKVGWWGNYLHTYGGDNELSSRVYEAGFKILPIDGARIHDREADDDLRKLNNIDGKKDPRAIKGHHPDSWAWGRRWRTTNGLVGAKIIDTPQLVNEASVKERIVYLPIYEQGWEIQKVQKRGLREALAKVGHVIEFDYVGVTAKEGKEKMFERLQALLEEIKPTIFLSQLHNDSEITGPQIEALRQKYPDTKFVNWNGDYWPQNLLSQNGLKLARSFHLQTTINRKVLEDYPKHGVTAAYWQIGYEPDGIGHEAVSFDDIVFLGSGYSKERQAFVKAVRSWGGFSFGLYGTGWPDGWAKGQCLYDFQEGCRIYQGAKISLGDSQWPETGFVSNRVFQALAAGGAALAHQWFAGMDQLGLVDGETIIIWRSLAELKEKLDYYLSHEDERKEIAEAGQHLALERHSFDARVNELFRMIDVELTSPEDWRY